MSAWALDAWRLPSTVAFLEAIERGLAVAPGLALRASPSLPDGLEAALKDFLLDRGRQIMPAEALPDRTPAVLLGDLLGLEPELGALVQGGFDNVAFVDARGIGAPGAGDLGAWGLFLGRLRAERGNRPFGLGVIILIAEEAPVLPGCPEVAWGGRLRRSDVVVWSEINAPLVRGEPLSTLAAALAVEVCGWRLDLASDLVRARDEDLLDPIPWLARRSEDSCPDRGVCALNGVRMACPIRLHRLGERAELDRRVWRAQLSALFPWLEARRQQVIARHREKLRLDPERYPRIEEVDELEIAPIAFQLDQRVPREEAAMLHALRRIRNNLAHRALAAQADLAIAFAWSD